jgi:hypothetical protein
MGYSKRYHAKITANNQVSSTSNQLLRVRIPPEALNLLDNIELIAEFLPCRLK